MSNPDVKQRPLNPASADEATPVRVLEIAVEGKVYQVQIREVEGSAAGQDSVLPLDSPAKTARGGAIAPPPRPQIQSQQKPVDIVAPMPGVVLRHVKQVGDQVKSGEVVTVLEAMKMQNSIVAPRQGTIASLGCDAGQMVKKGAVLAVIE